MGRCEVCETSTKPLYMCSFEDQPILSFCREHWIEHVADAHKESSYAQQQLRAFKATVELSDVRERPDERCKGGCGVNFAEFPEARHSEDDCPGPDCTCYEIIGGHQMGCYFFRHKERPNR